MSEATKIMGGTTEEIKFVLRRLSTDRGSRAGAWELMSDPSRPPIPLRKNPRGWDHFRGFRGTLAGCIEAMAYFEEYEGHEESDAMHAELTRLCGENAEIRGKLEAIHEENVGLKGKLSAANRELSRYVEGYERAMDRINQLRAMCDPVELATSERGAPPHPRGTRNSRTATG
jgi:hypothetical protein